LSRANGLQSSTRLEDGYLSAAVCRFSRTTKLARKPHEHYPEEEADDFDSLEMPAPLEGIQGVANQHHDDRKSLYDTTKQMRSFKQSFKSSRVAEVSDSESVARIRLVESYFARQASAY